MIGGGCAGLAAATRLAEQGMSPTLFEASSQLGGRARAVSWKGLQLDNGQHILLGAYGETLCLLSLAGIKPGHSLLRLPLQINVPGRFELIAPKYLPAPLHILAGLIRAKGLSLKERMAALRFILWMRLNHFTLSADETLTSLLTRKAQPANVIKLLWEPLCLAALNTPLDSASAQVFLNVLRDSFAQSSADSDMLLPRHDLSTIIAEPLAAYILAQGGNIALNAPISRLARTSNGFEIETADGKITQFDQVIVATSPFRVAELLAELPELKDIAALCTQFSYQPIYTIYLQYPENVELNAPMVGLTDSHGQWVFDRGRLCGQHGLLAVIVSAEGAHQKLTQEALAIAIRKELSHVFPHLPEPLWHKVIAEKRATFACIAKLKRPRQETALPGLYLAGDYTAGDYPATIEGAVRSGVQCANLILSHTNTQVAK
ncbi:MAG TPA: hydroxysqualene dehydroxylase HpnE [Methylophilaceae bacterium]